MSHNDKVPDDGCWYIWLCGRCGKKAVLPSRMIWVKCVVCGECGEDIGLKMIRALDGILVTKDEEEIVRRVRQ